MATLYQRNGQYYLNYSINGQRVRKVVGNDRKKAEIYLGELRYKLSTSDISSKRPDITLDFFINEYLEDCRIRLSENSHQRYQEVLDHFMNYCTNEQPINQFILSLFLGLTC